MDDEKKHFMNTMLVSWNHGMVPLQSLLPMENTSEPYLDRNGLRPSRYTVTKDGYVVMSSETGVLDIDPDNVEKHGRLGTRKNVPCKYG
jgi:glutamate synthase (ferredoxin)